MNRYTSKMLETDAAELNEELAAEGIRTQYIVGGRYGYTAVDVRRGNMLEHSGISGTVETGTARECMAAMYADANATRAKHYRNLVETSKGNVTS